MNKVFKVIWSEARNAYVVVSEIAKNHGSKSCSTKKLLAMLIATGVMTCASMAPAMAATNVDSNANVTVKKGATVTVAENATVTVGDNAIALGKGASAVKNSIAIGNGAYTQDGTLTSGQSVALGNGAVTGAKSTSIGSNAVGGREGTITIGANAKNGSLYATVIGTDSKVNNMTRNSGAAATIVGAKSEIKNDNKFYSGVANGIFGSANTIENSNGVTIQGSGNTVTNAYKDMYGWDFNLGGVSVKKDAGAVGVIGGMNTVSNQIYTNVIGFGNTVAGDADNISHDVFLAGSRNNLSNVSDSIVMGNENAITGVSNVISFGHQNTISANNAVAIGNGASVSVEGGVALGVGSVASTVAGALGYGADGKTDATWQATKGAVSVGGNGVTRQITNVAAGTEDTDAVNVAQLKNTNQRIDGVENQVISNSNRINQLGNRVNKVGAGAAALAALHPMDFDPDDKLTFSAGYGNYGGENAAAIGAYYRPDEKVMFSVAGTVGNGENMVNAGISFALDRTNHVSNSRTALAREVIDLRGQLAVMGAKMAKMEKAFGMLDETKTKLFPDVPANHWAYEYIAKLAGNGYIEGYPDGNFGGDRLMTRYEFAAMLYRAIEKGAALEEKIIKEFEPELGRIRVDRISGEDGDRDKIERVRVNDTKGERDHYGNKLAK